FGPRGRTDAAGLDSYPTYFTRVFLDNPSRDVRLSSLVCEEGGGRIVGFLGVVPRGMSMNGERLLAAISSQFVVDPAGQAGLVAVRLAKAFLDGPQDLSISDEATDVSRRIWEGLGGTTSLLHSLHWTRPLRPARLALSLLRNRGRVAPFAVAAGPLARIVGALATRIPGSHFRQSAPRVSADDLRAEALQAWRQGALAVTGRLQPRSLQALSDKYCLFHRRGPWMLVSAKKPRLVQSFLNGDAFFSRFDGEWCLGY